jgi:hypothetical protein
LSDLQTIRPGVGVGDLRFGSTRDEIRALAGDPSEVLGSDADEGSEVWVYEHAALALSFAADQDLRFVSCETFSARATLGDEAFVGLDRAAAEAALQGLELEFEWMGGPEEGSGRLAVPGAGLNLWFDDAVVESIGWSVAVDDQDHLIWP